MTTGAVDALAERCPSLTHLVDLRTWILFPDISMNEAARTFGAGIALELRFG